MFCHHCLRKLGACSAFVVIGVLTMIASLLGYAGSQFKPWLLLAYLTVGAISNAAQLFMVLAIFLAQEKLATAIENASPDSKIITPFIRQRDRFAAHPSIPRLWKSLEPLETNTVFLTPVQAYDACSELQTPKMT